MLNSVKVFLSQILDYAGMFPPAKLPLEEALRKYLHYRKTSAHRWMLGRFVCPTSRLQDCLTLAQAHEDAPLVHLTALGQQSSQEQLDVDLRAIQDFRRAWGNDAVIDMYEVALPKGAEIGELIQGVAERLRRANLRGFLEVPITSKWQDDVAKTANGIQHLGDAPLGMKLRCGGVTAEALPSDEDVAYFIARCRDANVPWKATAGLHHPARHWDASLGIWQHGFFNVFGAGLLAVSNALPEADLVAILSDRDGGHFRFDATGFAWKDLTCPVARIVEMREHWVTSFGSCSFEEPCDDLRALGLIE